MTTNRLPHSEQNGRFGFPWGWALLLTVLFVLLSIVLTMLIQQWDSLFAPAPVATAVPGSAAITTEQKIQISPTSGSAGINIAVWGTGWAANETVQLYLDDLGSNSEPPVIAQATANETGLFFVSFTFPADIEWRSLPDVHIVAQSTSSERAATAVFALQSQLISPTEVATLPPTPTPTPIPTATATPTPTPTPIPTPTCTYDMGFVADMSIPDDTTVQPGVGFLKTWRIRNSGNCAWPAGTSWVFIAGNLMSGSTSIPVAATNPRETADVSVYLIAPSTPGTYTGYWSLRLPNGTAVGERCYVRIVVPSPPTPTPTPVPVPTIYNWRGEYFANSSLSGTLGLVRDDTAVDFNWGFDPPAVALPADNFSARWTRSLYFAEGDYRFYVHSDDGVRLWIDSVLRLNEWHDADGSTYTADVALTAGNHFIQVEFYEAQGIAQIQLWWEETTPYTDWRGEYWANRYLAGTPAFVRNDTDIDFNWGEQAPFPALPTDEFSARWVRTLTFTPGTYRLYAQADDGVRVAVDNLQVIDEWHSNDGSAPYAIDLFLDGEHTLYVDYFESHGQAQIHVWYELIEAKPDSVK